MDKKIIINKFLEKGKLLSPEALEFLSDIGIEDYLDKDYKEIVIKKPDMKIGKVKILKNLEYKPKEISTEDFVKFYKSKYEKMKQIILERTGKSFISLNKLGRYRKEVYVLGIVREIKEKGEKHILELEDLTTTVPVIFDKVPKDVELDDVIVVKAVSGEKVLFGKEVIFPDVPLRKPKYSFGRACFIGDLHLEQVPISYFRSFLTWFKQQNIKYLFVAGDTIDDDKFEENCPDATIFHIPGHNIKDYPEIGRRFKNKNIVSLSNPSMVQINDIKILMVHNFNINMLKKRYLGKSSLILPEDFLVLDDIPDIIHCGHTHEPFVQNYKSITIVNAGSLLTRFLPVIIDFKTREYKQVSIKF
jgi:DNA polymerase II small subunit